MAKSVEQLNARVPVGTSERIGRYAESHHLSKNEVVNRAIEQYLSSPIARPAQGDLSEFEL